MVQSEGKLHEIEKFTEKIANNWQWRYEPDTNEFAVMFVVSGKWNLGYSKQRHIRQMMSELTMPSDRLS